MRSALSIGGLLLLGCTRPKPEPETVKADPVIDAAPPVPSAPPSPPPASVWCESDKDCGYDDPCFAKACVGKSKPAACDESAPPPGRCVCGARVCTMVLKDVSKGSVKTGCKTYRDCKLDPPTGKCVAGDGAVFIEDTGGFCACTAGTCTPEFVDPVACKKNTDCNFLEDPMRPVAASKVPRTFPPITPCKGGERDSVCEKGRCVVRVWTC